MGSILETVMLVCFGFSWPISVWRNIKAKTAKSMSLGFILLIIAGYVAGIGAKNFDGGRVTNSAISNNNTEGFTPLPATAGIKVTASRNVVFDNNELTTLCPILSA